MSDGPFEDVDALLKAGVGDVFPGAVACVWLEGRCVFHRAVGTTSVSEDSSQVSEQTIYDLASLTKPMAVGTLLMRAVGEGKLGLNDTQCIPMHTVSAGRSMVSHEHWSEMTIAQLASHCSGLPAWVDFGAMVRDQLPGAVPGSAAVQQYVKDCVRTTPLCDRPGHRVCYSDLGYMALGWMLEQQLGLALDRQFEWVAEQFGLSDTGYRPLGTPVDPLCVPTECCTVRSKTMHGEVHDSNAWYLGGVAGHAGLFGTALDVARWANGLLDIVHGEPGPLQQQTVQQFWSPNASPSLGPGTWRLCFDGVSASGSSAGTGFGPSAVGHLGYTGTSVWIEVERRLVVVLLSNRVHPVDHKVPRIKQFRPLFHDAVVQAIRL